MPPAGADAARQALIGGAPLASLHTTQRSSAALHLGAGLHHALAAARRAGWPPGTAAACRSRRTARRGARPRAGRRPGPLATTPRRGPTASVPGLRSSVHGISAAARPLLGCSSSSPARSRRTRSPSHPSTKAVERARAPGIGVDDEGGPPVDPLPELSERARRAERYVHLDRPVDVIGEVGVEGSATVVQVHGHRIHRGPHPLEGEVDEGHVAHRAQRLGPEPGQRPQSGAATGCQHHPDEVVHEPHPRTAGGDRRSRRA